MTGPVVTYGRFLLALAEGVTDGEVTGNTHSLPLVVDGLGPVLSVRATDAGIVLCGPRLRLVDDGRVSVLEGENRQLRDEVSRLRQLTHSHGPRVDAAVGNEPAAARRRAEADRLFHDVARRESLERDQWEEDHPDGRVSDAEALSMAAYANEHQGDA